MLATEKKKLEINHLSLEKEKKKHSLSENSGRRKKIK